MNDEVKLILTKLKIVSEEKENGAYICDKEHSKLLLSYIEQLEKENKILRENAEHNDKVVDKVNWEINILKHNRDKAIDKLYCWGEVLNSEFQKEMLNILKGDGDE